MVKKKRGRERERENETGRKGELHREGGVTTCVRGGECT